MQFNGCTDEVLQIMSLSLTDKSRYQNLIEKIKFPIDKNDLG